MGRGQRERSLFHYKAEDIKGVVRAKDRASTAVSLMLLNCAPAASAFYCAMGVAYSVGE